MRPIKIGDGKWILTQAVESYDFAVDYDPVLDKATQLKEVLDELETVIASRTAHRSQILGRVDVVDASFITSTT